MIEKFADLDFTPKDEAEQIEKKVQEKLGISLDQMRAALAQYLRDHSDEVVVDMMNIAPLGDYEKLIEETKEMAIFLREEVVKPEHWKLDCVKSLNEQALQFVFLSDAVDDGETFKGFVTVSFDGKIKHSFCIGEA
jgi:cobalamin biosynthesis Co2+ chelatase CbiK